MRRVSGRPGCNAIDPQTTWAHIPLLLPHAHHAAMPAVITRLARSRGAAELPHNTACLHMKVMQAGYGSYLENVAYNALDAERRGMRAAGVLPSQLRAADLDHSAIGPAFHSRACKARSLQCVYDGPKLCKNVREDLQANRTLKTVAGEVLKLTFWEVAALLARTFTPSRQLNDFLADQALQKMKKPCLAVHLRYGDSCLASHSGVTARRCEPVSWYLDATAQFLLKYSAYRSVVVISDSRAAILINSPQIPRDSTPRSRFSRAAHRRLETDWRRATGYLSAGGLLLATNGSSS